MLTLLILLPLVLVSQLVRRRTVKYSKCQSWWLKVFFSNNANLTPEHIGSQADYIIAQPMHQKSEWKLFLHTVDYPPTCNNERDVWQQWEVMNAVQNYSKNKNRVWKVTLPEGKFKTVSTVHEHNIYKNY